MLNVNVETLKRLEELKDWNTKKIYLNFHHTHQFQTDVECVGNVIAASLLFLCLNGGEIECSW